MIGILFAVAVCWTRRQAQPTVEAGRSEPAAFGATEREIIHYEERESNGYLR